MTSAISCNPRCIAIFSSFVRVTRSMTSWVETSASSLVPVILATSKRAWVASSALSSTSETRAWAKRTSCDKDVLPTLLSSLVAPGLFTRATRPRCVSVTSRTWSSIFDITCLTTSLIRVVSPFFTLNRSASLRIAPIASSLWPLCCFTVVVTCFI